MEKIVVTSGKTYIDIDGYASCIAYSKLLNSINYDSIAYTSAIANKSVSAVINELNFKFDKYEYNSNDKFIVLDVSNPKMLDKIVNENNIIEIIDHHMGYSEYWEEKNIKTEIEFIGSICTIIFEKFEKNNKLNLLDSNLCKLLIAGILDNTLNLKASITTNRDIEAYNKLLFIGKIDNNWKEEYFISCQKEIENNLNKAIIDDIKIEYINDKLPKVFGQLLVYNKESIMSEINLIKETLNNYGSDWIFNLISLNDGKSYLISNSKNVKKQLEILFNKKFVQDVMKLDKFMLRKEIMKLVRELV